MQRILKEVAQIKPKSRPDQRPEQRAGASNSGLHDELAGCVEHERVRRHETLHDGEQAAGEAGIGGGYDEGAPPCPNACSGSAYQQGEWRDGSYGAVSQVSGRDAYGYLVWPGKAPEQ